MDRGWINRLIISQDIPFYSDWGKSSFKKFEAIRSFDNITGFTHIFESVLPKLKARGVSEDEIHTLLVKNPARVFTEDTHIKLTQEKRLSLSLSLSLYSIPMPMWFSYITRRNNGYSKRLAASAVVPVVVLDDVKDAVATAKALLAGGVDVMEITFRTAAAADSIKAVTENCPDMLVGAGTVITLEQCKRRSSAVPNLSFPRALTKTLSVGA